MVIKMVRLRKAWDKNWYHRVEIPVKTKFSELPIEVHINLTKEGMLIYTFAEATYYYANLELAFISGVC